jgi:MFS family permease
LPGWRWFIIKSRSKSVAASDDPKSDSQERQPSSTSLWALDGLNFFLADVRDGMGPFLGTFLREHHHWDAGRVGIALAASQIGTVLAQTPLGALVDRIRWKRLAVAIAAAVVAGGCVLLYLVPTMLVVLAAQTAIGAAAAIFPPAVAAITLGLVGRAVMPRQTGRNEAYNHGGNFVAAALAGACAYFFGYGAMFFLVAAMAAASAGAVMVIREREIDHELARGADEDKDDGHGVVGVLELFHDRRILIFVASAVLFHFANAAMLPLVGQKSSDGLKDGAAVVMSACIIAAQLVMIPVALAASRLSASWGRKPVFLIGFGVLPIRGACRRRPHQGNGPIQPDTGGSCHGNRSRRRSEQPAGRLRRQGSRLRRRLHHARRDCRGRRDFLLAGHARDPSISGESRSRASAGSDSGSRRPGRERLDGCHEGRRP